jgi:enhancing lycopene biosynthesis protein 2
MPKVAVILSGCGYLDGTEIHEAVFTLLYLDKSGAEFQCFAPNKNQQHVVDHLTGRPTNETRNVLTESARIARGQVRDIREARMADFDALVMPGGYGAAKNLSTFATDGANAGLDPDVARLIAEAFAAKKPILAICISPAVLAAGLKRVGAHAEMTIGNDQGTAQAIESLGSKHQVCPVDDFVVDEEARIITTPAYMLGPGPKDVAAGIEKSVSALMSWLRVPVG